MEAAVTIITKALENVEAVEQHSNRKQSTLSNRSLKNTVSNIKTKQQKIRKKSFH